MITNENINNTAGKLGDGLVSLLGVVSNALFLSIVVIMTLDVIGRYGLNMPLVGAMEIIELLMLFLVFMTIPIATYKCDHIRIALLEKVLPEKFRIFVFHFSNFLLLAGSYLISERLWELSERYARYGSKTEFLELPLAYLTYGGILSCYMSMILVVLLFLKNDKTLIHNASHGE